MRRRHHPRGIESDACSATGRENRNHADLETEDRNGRADREQQHSKHRGLFGNGRVEAYSESRAQRERDAKQRMNCKPDRQIEDDADDGGGDGRERADRPVAAQLFDEGRAEENPEKARVKVTQVASSPPSAPARSGDNIAGDRERRP